MTGDSRRQITRSGSGTASMKNVSQASIENLTIALLRPGEQVAFAGLATALRVASQRAEHEAQPCQGFAARS